MRKRLFFGIGLCFWLGFLSCVKDQSSASSCVAPDFIYKTATQLTVDVVYEPGAEPYTGNLPNSDPVWSLLQENVEALFDGRAIEPTVSVPTTLDGMTEISAQNQTGWTSEEIQALASYKTSACGGTSSSLLIAFVKGNYESGGELKTNVLGVSVGQTGVIAMFKEVVEASGGAIVKRFVEQATLVHETGHALGLVNNGVSMTTSHQDSDNGAHCTNPDCVMYWLNEGKEDLATFVQTYISSGSKVMFGEECLNDAHAF